MLLSQSCSEKKLAIVTKVSNTPKCPPFVYKQDTGKICGKIIRKKINEDTELTLSFWSNDSIIFGISQKI
jgi:hypothetical protein